MGNGKGRVCILLLLLFWCPVASVTMVSAVQAAEEGTFTGTWNADGTKSVLALGDERETAIFKLFGHVRLTKKIGGDSDFWAECIGLADPLTGNDIRCVWRSLDGDEIYLVLKGTQIEKGGSAAGTIIGGTGKAKGITGTLKLTWTLIFKEEDTEKRIGGFSKDLSGTYKLP